MIGYVLCGVVSLVFFGFGLDLYNKLRKKENEVHVLKQEKIALQVELAHTAKHYEEKLAWVERSEVAQKERFMSLSSEVLQKAQISFFDVAKETLGKYEEKLVGAVKDREVVIDGIVKPLRSSLEKVDQKIQELEKARGEAYAGISERLKSIVATHDKLHAETENLVKALRQPHVRGRWGELQLKRVVELAGMAEYCDFSTQETVQGEEGALRPDLVVKLPNNRIVVVDAKTPLHAYLEAVESKSDAFYEEKMLDHARQLKRHIFALHEKNYAQQFNRTPEFVVLFLPSEAIFTAATLVDKELFEIGIERNVLIATPMTLIALLRAVAFGWKEETITENALKIAALGKTLYERLVVLSDHMEKLQKNFSSSQESLSKFSASFEKRVLVVARKFQEMGIGNEELAPSAVLDE